MDEKNQYEYDSDKERWNYYATIYPFVDTNKIFPDKNGNRLIGAFTRNKNEPLRQVNKGDKESYIEIAGDCFFNFKSGNNTKLLKFVYNKKEPNKELVEKLDELSKKKFHSNENCVLMPITGALNNVKNYIYIKDNTIKTNGRPRTSGVRFDRPDSFICLLDDFFKKEKDIHDLRSAGEFFTHSIFKAALENQNFTELYDFLSPFQDIYSYCEVFLGIGKDDDFVDEMLEEGRKSLNTEEAIYNYIKLAEKFWKKREEFSKLSQK